MPSWKYKPGAAFFEGGAGPDDPRPRKRLQIVRRNRWTMSQYLVPWRHEHFNPRRLPLLPHNH